MNVKAQLVSLDKRIKNLPCKAHHVVFPNELENKKYNNGDPWIECSCDSHIVVFDIDVQDQHSVEVKDKPPVLLRHEMPGD